MHDVIGSYQRLERLYRLYLRSAFPLRSRLLAAERDDLLRHPGILSQPPLIEPVPVYPSSGRTLADAARELGPGFADLAHLGVGVMDPAFTLYEHQCRSLQEFLVEKHDIVVTTGTGSGKTECFLLPLLGQIARESATWSAPMPEPAGRRWWADDHTARVPQWGHATRPAAMRGMILYPLNALVEDQLRRLRAALDSDETHRWLNDHRGGNRVTFGRYTSATPLAGAPDDKARVKRLRVGLRDSAEEREQIERAIARDKDPAPAEVRYHFARLDGGEAWSRWDMQASPPDIMITNYSMLNIMLMRGIEDPIFRQTREWLAAPSHPERQFSLVIDELHAYRGTPGTEVAYILRLLLDRLGLTPESDKLRIMATTASLEEGDEGKRFLREFFGRDNFRFIGGDQEKPDLAAQTAMAPHAAAFAAFGRALADNDRPDRPLWADGAPDPDDPNTGRQMATLAHALAPAVPGNGTADPLASPATALGAALSQVNAAEALRAAAAAVSSDGKTVRAARATVLDRTLFSDEPVAIALNGAPSDGALVSDAMRGYLLALGTAKRDGRSPQPIRGHLFFHNMQNLWACVDPNCPIAAEGRASVEPDKRPTVGRLYASHRLTCECGARVLDLIVCEQCGEVFLGGFKSKGDGNSLVFLTPDQPELEQVPDLTLSERTHDAYAIFWPCPPESVSAGYVPLDEAWVVDNVERTWKRAALKPATGQLEPQVGTRISGNGGVPGWRFFVNTKWPNFAHAFPEKCPCCDADRTGSKVTTYRSPLRNHRTGFQRATQVIADALFREMKSDSADASKLVVFSDSRQDAAKLAGGIQRDHYRDMVRLAFIQAYQDYWAGLVAYLRHLRPRDEQLDQLAHWNPIFSAELSVSPHPRTIELAAWFQRIISTELENSALKWNQGLDNDGESPAAREWRALIHAYPRAIPLEHLRGVIRDALLAVGMAPGGSNYLSLKYRPQSGGDRGWRDWFDCYDWTRVGQNGNAAPPVIHHMTDWQRSHVDRMATTLLSELMVALFPHQARTIEGLGLGRINLREDFDQPLAPLVSRTIDAIIRSLSVSRIYTGSDTIWTTGNSRDQLRRKEAAFADATGAGRRDVERALKTQGQAVASNRGLALDPRALAFIPATGEEASQGFQCPRCAAFFLQDVGVCPVCPPSKGATAPKLQHPAKPGDFDYYVELARTGTIRPFRMNCEELTGQTDADERPKRQRWFQEVFVGDEIPRVQGIDLLSVTTTMEAGVDIGALNAVMLANMPPRRFNYQQRVGRAGRRSGGVSLAVTFCRGRSHDDFYFQRPEEITGDPPPPPYIDTSSKRIFERVLNKEVLRRAFLDLRFETGDVETDKVKNVHGEFGRADEWPQRAVPVQRWLSEPDTALSIAALIARLSVETPWSGPAGKEQREVYLHGVQTQLIDAITGIAASDEYHQEALSERLANAGLLPMFGFPTRTRNLFTTWPSSGHPWPPKGSVDRNLDIAISQFAPGSQTVKDKAVHTAAGVATFIPRGNAIEIRDGFSPPLSQRDNPHRIGMCRRCQAVIRFGPDRPATEDCPVCHEVGKVRVLDAREPGDFFTDLERQDFEGQFEWRPRSSRPTLGIDDNAGPDSVRETIREPARAGNARAIPLRDRIMSLNDDGGRGGFAFRDAVVGKDLHRGAYVAESESVDEDETTPSWGNVKASGETRQIALLAQRVTDVMLFDIDRWPAGIAADPTTVEGRAAWYSLAFWLRLAAGQLLDIDPGELQAGFRSHIRDEQPTGQAFLADQLENGAGYCRELATAARLDALLRQADVSLAGTIAGKWAGAGDDGHAHRNECDTSCNRCLRDYNNMPYHGLLDWRLALDMARLAATGQAPGLDEPWSGLPNPWQQLTGEDGRRDTAPVPTTLARLGFEVGIPVGQLTGYRSMGPSRKHVIVVRHPLWTDEHPEWRRAAAEARQRFPGYDIRPLSPFLILRRPVDCL